MAHASVRMCGKSGFLAHEGGKTRRWLEALVLQNGRSPALMMMSPYYLLAFLAVAIPIASGYPTEDGSLPRNCQDILEQRFLQVGHYVAYHTVNNTKAATMIYCDEKDGMQLLYAKDGPMQRSRPASCHDLQDQGMDYDGYGIIYPFVEHPETAVFVLCNMTTDGGGWTVIHRRNENYPQLEDFKRTFEEYASGFGDINYDFYIGNEVINALTDSTMNELWVNIEDDKGFTGYAHYKYFHVGAKDASELSQKPYMMDSGFYEGTIGESLGYSNGMGFTTADQDNDVHDGNCAKLFCGVGWWYRDCFPSNLNCPYGNSNFKWTIADHTYVLKKAQMMVRPLQ